jgi:beta-lactam-binding protein with PASTA domain
MAALLYAGVSMERVSSVPEVPELEGRILRDARERLDPLGVQVRTEYEFSSQPEDIVLEQAPPAGTDIKAGDTVVLTVSRGPEPSFVERIGDGLTEAWDGIGNSLDLDDIENLLGG